MRPVKRVEIIIDRPQLEDIIEAIERAKVTGYTIMHDVTGRGNRGRQMGDGLSGEFSNSYILIVCEEEVAGQVVETVRPILKQRGGMCLVSDAVCVNH